MRVLLDFPDSPGHVLRRAFSSPLKILKAYHPNEILELLEQVTVATGNGAHAVGFLGYECAPAFDPAAKVRPPGRMPIAQFGIFSRVESALAADDPNLPFRYAPWQMDTAREAYADKIRQIRRAIEQGETYQINYTIRTYSRLEGSGRRYYEQLRHAQQADYCAWLDCGDFQILSLSPELFFSREDRTVTTKPMKGTVRRGYQPEEDAALEKWLSESRKNRAENLMIVDLLRNDLSRVAQPGSVSVPALFTVERYPTVLQMTSTVVATLRDGMALRDIFTALFPCGSITGAPKLKSMEWIAQLESSPRGPYCGAIGWIKPGGDAQFNVAIRTLVLDTPSGDMTCGLGGGITWDSRWEEEYAEVQVKSRFLEHESDEYDLLETLLVKEGGIPLRHYHLERLRRSAQALGFPLPGARLENLLAACSAQYPEGAYRVRLCYSREGSAHLEGWPLAPTPKEPATVELARSPIRSSWPGLSHKTTRRDPYDGHVKAMLPGHFDVLLWNERDEVTEFTRGNMVIELDGRLLTPALESGLLPGVFRQALLDEGKIAEKIIPLAMLERAQALWFINSVRGWVRVVLDKPTS